MSAAPLDAESMLSARFTAAIREGVELDPHLAWRGRHLHARCMIEIGTTKVLLRIDAGRVTHCASPPPLMSTWDFAIRGSVAAWDALWRSPPPPGWHDLFALTKRGEVRIEGDLQPFMANLQFLKDLLALPRARGSA